MTRMMLMMIKCVLSRQVVACESAAPASNDFLITYCFCSHVLPILILIPRYCSLITCTTKSFSSWWWCYKLYKVSGIGVSNGEGDGNSGGDDQKHHNTGFNVHLHLSSPSSCLWWGGLHIHLHHHRHRGVYGGELHVHLHRVYGGEGSWNLYRAIVATTTECSNCLMVSIMQCWWWWEWLWWLISWWRWWWRQK